MKKEMIKGSILVKTPIKCVSGAKGYLVLGIIMAPEDIELKEDHLYTLVGSRITGEELDSVNLQILMNSAKDVSKKVKGKNLTAQIPVLEY